MTQKQMKKGVQVVDRWWPWYTGVITWVGRTRYKVTWLNTGRVMVYDKDHIQFLEVERG
jgi:hypothetical protein